MSKHVECGLVWRDVESRVLWANITAEYLRWMGTKYMSGQSLRGKYADCIGFVCRWLCDIRRIPAAEIPRIPSDTCFHSPETARAALHDLLRIYAPVEKVEDGWVEPGDIVITGPPGGGPGHVMLVGARENTLWHCNRSVGVCQVGFSFIDDAQRLVAVYRPTDKADWT